MIINGSGNSALHIEKNSDFDKWTILVTKQVSDGFHKSAKLIADNFKTYENDSHSIEISGSHYAVVPGMDFFPMVNRISKSRNYRRYNNQMQRVA